MAGTRLTSPFSKASLILILLLIPAAAAQGPHGLSDHHAFVAGRSHVPPQGHVEVQLNQTYFDWATIWYSARVESGPPVTAFILDEANRKLLNAGLSYQLILDTADGPSLMTGGLAPSLLRGLYFLILQNPGTEETIAKWEVFLEPRLQGEPGTISAGAPPFPSLEVSLTVALLMSAVALGVVRRLRLRKD